MDLEFLYCEADTLFLARVISDSLRPFKVSLILDRVNCDIKPGLRRSSPLDVSTFRIGRYLDKYQFSLAYALLNFSFEQSSIIVIEKLAQPKVLRKLPKKLRCLAPL